MSKNFIPSFECIRSEKWIKLTPNERRSTLQMIEDMYAKKQGRTSRIVKGKRFEKGTDGKYNHKHPKYLRIKKDFLTSPSPHSSYSAVQALLHEGYHAYQCDCLDGKICAEKMPRQDVFELWQKNRVVYEDDSSRKLPFAYYRFQPLEAHAFDYAKSEMEKLENLFGDDKYYNVFIDGCNALERYYLKQAIADVGEEYVQKIQARINRIYQENQSASNKAISIQKESQ